MEVNVHIDPDAQATVTDFLDYTEYLPADLFRSLTLIRKLDENNIEHKNKIHSLLKTYGELPKLQEDRPDPQELRKEISYYLELALNARESAFAESTRLYDEVDRHYNRLTSVISKLKALPKPPSRDPTPVPISPQANRARAETSGHPRITLRLDGARVNASRNYGSVQRPRHRRITVPGEVLPPPDPDGTPPGFTESEWESEPPLSPVRMPVERKAAHARDRLHKSGGVRKHKVPKLKLLKGPKPPRPPRAPRPPGVLGTNVHSTVAGISTSNALSLLTPPPDDAKAGSKHAPWTRLTEWEMAKLRKRMKKNAIWTPSETMIRRELAEAGRGADNYLATKARCDETGEPFIDDDDLANRPKGQPLKPGEISADSLGLNSGLSNKGMKLNEMKKLKRELQQRQAAAEAAAEADKVARSLGNLGSSFRTLFDKPPTPRLADPTPTVKKRKREDESRSLLPPISLASTVKKRKSEKSRTSQVVTPTTITTTTTTTTVPLAAPASSPVKENVKSQPSSPSNSRKAPPRRLSIILKPPASPAETKTPRAASRASSRLTSAAPEPRSAQDSRQRTPDANLTPMAALFTAASRRSKRPAPGPVASPDGGAAVIEAKRKSAPRKKGAAADKEADDGLPNKRIDEEGVEEEIDPNEPRYCYCGDVSYGEMVACDNENCEREWFHLGCVGLSEPPPRRTKWYCDDCKKLLKK